MRNRSSRTGRSRYLMTSLLALSTGLVNAQSTTSSTSPVQKDNDLEELVVTGSRLTNRGFNTPSPVTFIGAEEYSLSGTQNVETLLNDTAQFSGSQNNNQTGNTVQAGQPIGTATLNLRNFGAQRNLVLVNGRRFAISGPDFTTDINTIPVALIKRTEVVTGGSSAVYGSDAITGVVNFIMRDNFEGVEVDVQHNWDQHTHTPTTSADLTLGGNFADGRGNMVVSIGYLDRDGYTRADRGDWAGVSLGDGCVTAVSWSSTRAGTPMGIPSGQTCLSAGGQPGLIFSGSATVPNGRVQGIPTYQSAQSNANLDAALAAAGLQSMTSLGFLFGADGKTVRPYVAPGDAYDLGPLSYIVTPEKRWAGNLFGHLDFNDKVTGYVELHTSETTADVQIAPTSASGNFLVNINNPYLSPEVREVMHQMDLRETASSSVTAGSLTLANAPNDGLAMINLNRRFSDLGGRVASADHSVFRTALGVRGKLGNLSDKAFRNLSYDAYYSYARTSESDFQNNSISLSRFQQSILSSGTNAPVLNPFGQNLTPASAAAIRISSNAIIQAEQQVFAANLGGEAFSLPMGPLDFSLGVEWRYDKARYIPDAFLSSGDVSGWNAARATSGNESVKEAFTELRVPIVSGLPAIKNLTLNGAYRYSSYNLNGVSGVSTYSFGTEWVINDNFSVRAQRQRAIRAPNVGELFGGQGTNGPQATDPCSSRQPIAQQTAAVRAVCEATGVPSSLVFDPSIQASNFLTQVTGGNQSLKPETSNTTTVGVVFNSQQASVSLDYFNISLDGAIAQLGGGGLAGVLDLCYNVLQNPNSTYCKAVHRDPASGQIAAPDYVSTTNANIGGIKTSGFDLEGRLELSGKGNSHWEFSENITYTREFTVTPDQERPNLYNDCKGAFGGTCGQPMPYWKGAVRGTWLNNGLSASLRLRYIGKVTVDSYLLPHRKGQSNAPALNTLTNPEISAQTYLDLTGGYTFHDGKVGLTLGIRNLLDKDPPILGSSQLPSDNTIPATYDVQGRVFFVGANLKF